MAILGSKEETTFEISPQIIEGAQLYYAYYFRWKGQSIISENILEECDDCPTGLLEASDDLCLGGIESHEMRDPLVNFIREVLLTNKADYWQPMHSEMKIALYPDNYFPFLPSHYELISESKKYANERKARERLKKEKKVLPDDNFTIMVAADNYNFKGADTHSSLGVSINLIVTRQALEDFTIDLEKEFFALIKMTDEDDLEC